MKTATDRYQTAGLPGNCSDSDCRAKRVLSRAREVCLVHVLSPVLCLKGVIREVGRRALLSLSVSYNGEVLLLLYCDI